MSSPVVKLTVDFVGQNHDVVVAGNFGHLLELAARKRLSSGIGRIVQHQDPGGVPGTPAQLLKLLRCGEPTILDRRGKGQDRASNDPRLRFVRYPGWRRNDDLSVVANLQEEHQYLRSRPNQNILGGALDSERPPVVIGNGFTEFHEALDRQIILACRVPAEFRNDGLRHGKRRLPHPEFEDIDTLLP